MLNCVQFPKSHLFSFSNQNLSWANSAHFLIKAYPLAISKCFRGVSLSEAKKRRQGGVQFFVTHTWIARRASSIRTPKYHIMSERLTAKIFRLTVMRSCQTKQTMWGRYKVKYRTPLQAAARFALEKKVLNKKHCIMVAVVKVSRNRKKRSGLL